MIWTCDCYNIHCGIIVKSLCKQSVLDTSKGIVSSGHFALSMFVSRPVRPNFMDIWQYCQRIIKFCYAAITVEHISLNHLCESGQNLCGGVIILNQKVFSQSFGADTWKQRRKCFDMKPHVSTNYLHSRQPRTV